MTRSSCIPGLKRKLIAHFLWCAARSAATGPQPGDHTHTTLRSRGDRRLRSACASPPPPPSHPAPAAHGSRSSQNCAPQPAPGCAARTRTQHLVPPRRPTPCTRRTWLHLAMPPTHPLHLLAAARALEHTPQLTPGCGVHTRPRAHCCLHRPRRSKGAPACMSDHAQPQSHTNAMWHPSHTQSPLQLSPAPPAARTHTPSLRARWMPAMPPMPCVLAARAAACCRPPCLCPQPLIPPALPRCRS